MDSFRRPVLLDATLLKCALLAVALPQALVETKDQSGRADNKNSLQKLLERGVAPLGFYRIPFAFTSDSMGSETV